MKSRTLPFLLVLIAVLGGWLGSFIGHRTQPPSAGEPKFGGQISAGPSIGAGRSGTTASDATAAFGSGAVGVTKAQPFTQRITRGELGDFARQSYPDGRPAYEGEAVMAYVRVSSSGRKTALTPNQSGEYPRILTQPGEAVEVRLAFPTSAPGTRVAVAAQDGGALHGGKVGQLELLDGDRQLAFGFRVSANPGIHRVTFTTSAGEAKTLNFWAGPEPRLNEAIAAQMSAQRRATK